MFLLKQYRRVHGFSLALLMFTALDARAQVALLDRASPTYVIGTTPPPVQLEILSRQPH